jgi:DNA-binding transcriptional regulator YdaS (Cro superfamily)
MILKDWLKSNSIKPYVFAKSIGMAPATIYRNLSGNHRMSARFAVKVEAETNGQVSRTEAVWPEAFSKKDEEGSSTPIQF